MTDAPRVLGPGLVLGMGLGGFVDGILLHQILQWHHMLSGRGYDPAVQITADGLFHAMTWVAVLLGLLWLWRRVRLSSRPSWLGLIGPMLAGWGLFNVVEGMINHQLLSVHHVKPGPNQLWYDAAYLGLGLILVVAGALLYARSGSRPVMTGPPRG